MNDICLILEGTYPYVAGGVSTWVYDLIKHMPDKTFSIVYLGAHRPAIKKTHYDIPPNVVDFQEYYLFDYQVLKEKKKKASKNDYEILEYFLTKMPHIDANSFQELVRVIGNKETRTINLFDLVHSYQGWELLKNMYKKIGGETSFIDYFWTWRFTYLPLFSLLRIPLPPARVYHTVSTGYAGIVGSMCKLQYHRPLLLTEHGIYTRERKIEIAQADWIYSETSEEIKVKEEQEFFKEWWSNLFSFFSFLTYEVSDEIITLYEGNRDIQLEEGADYTKTQIIPNGITINKFSHITKNPPKEKFRVGFMGRVVPIKDVKTFIRACKIIAEELGDVEIYIMGPTDEDEDYYKECALLTELESIQDIVHFTGKIEVLDYYPKIDIIVLTSISEAQPIVILEAMAGGIPIVATDVGACCELLHGRSGDDQLLGSCGIVTPIFSPQSTAEAVIKILKDPALYARMSETGHKRSEQYYQMNDVMAHYKMLYDRYMETVAWR